MGHYFLDKQYPDNKNKIYLCKMIIKEDNALNTKIIIIHRGGTYYFF